MQSDESCGRPGRGAEAAVVNQSVGTRMKELVCKKEEELVYLMKSRLSLSGVDDKLRHLAYRYASLYFLAGHERDMLKVEKGGFDSIIDLHGDAGASDLPTAEGTFTSLAGRSTF